MFFLPLRQGPEMVFAYMRIKSTEDTFAGAERKTQCSEFPGTFHQINQQIYGIFPSWPSLADYVTCNPTHRNSKQPVGKGREPFHDSNCGTIAVFQTDTCDRKRMCDRKGSHILKKHHLNAFCFLSMRVRITLKCKTSSRELALCLCIR